MQCACAVLLTVTGLAQPHFPHIISKKTARFFGEKQFIEHKMCVLIFSLSFLKKYFSF
jgi:hypothetical protein